ncbi:LOB domain-containing protein 16-like [Dorcoceras hygrometricum]|uniref:LOB domain-containing protein 16-like n=1 Tax=Dorcoceras hygrometricum TaxID=472368 RepID=A0A2Z7AI36_9LAMI|nr:LOB domain-containing protein 16-like [Dorcoceras hygrometricum]
MSGGTGSPCGACKFLRRKCAADCVFAPYFCTEQGPTRFAAIHKVFGASNVSKLLLHVPVPDRYEAVVTISYEAQARIRDPVYGCVAHIFALQQQVACLQAQLMLAKAQMSQNLVQTSRTAENLWPNSGMTTSAAGGLMGSMFPFQSFPIHNMSNSITPQSSFDSIDHCQNNGIVQGDHVVSFQQPYSKKRASQTDLSELQALAFRMMKNEN